MRLLHTSEYLEMKISITKTHTQRKRVNIWNEKPLSSLQRFDLRF